MKTKIRLSLKNAKKEWNKENLRRLLFYTIAAFLINFILEMLSRRSIAAGVTYLAERPLQFFYDALIILFMLSVALIFRKRNFFFLLFSAIWLGLGLTNCILLGVRATPLTMPDIWLIGTVRDIIEIYLPQIAIVGMMLGIALLIGAIILIWIHSDKYKVSYYFAAFHILLIGGILALFTGVFIRTGTLDSQFPNLPDAYAENGFAYCFSASAVTQGVDKPDGYDQERMEQIISQQKELSETREKTPNIVFVQLESFFDVNYLSDFTFSENPVPNFQRLKRNYSTGLFFVPSIGAGTANTEFEVLTGMNLDHFGVGEYPYKTVVKHQACDSIAYTLRDLGYRTHAMHNNNATFYGRDKVYANVGFDTFISEEYMHDVTYNALSWAEDSVLTAEIINALRSSEEKDLVFTVSVQPHGRYPTEPLEGAPTITVTGIEDMERKNRFEYYLHQLKESDLFIGDLVDTLTRFEEPTVVVFYGDHLPALGITQEELSYGTIQSTEYVIWANYNMQKIDRDVQAYQLSAVAFDRVGIHEGTVFRYHQSNLSQLAEEGPYQEDLCLLEYDLLYGDRYVMGEVPSLVPTDMMLGVDEISIDYITVDKDGEHLGIFGENFTPFSIILLNGDQVETQFVSKNELRAEETSVDYGDRVAVVQVSATDQLMVLSSTKEYLYADGEKTYVNAGGNSISIPE